VPETDIFPIEQIIEDARNGQSFILVDALIRVHQVDLVVDILGWKETRQDYVQTALRTLAAHNGAAVAVFVHDLSPTSISQRVGGGAEAYLDYAYTHGYRDYGICA